MTAVTEEYEEDYSNLNYNYQGSNLEDITQQSSTNESQEHERLNSLEDCQIYKRSKASQNTNTQGNGSPKYKIQQSKDSQMHIHQRISAQSIPQQHQNSQPTHSLSTLNQNQSFHQKSFQQSSNLQSQSILSKIGQNDANNPAQNNQSDTQFYEFTEVFVWGDDRWGQLGLYHQKQKKGNQSQTCFKIPKTCSFNILIRQVSCGENHSAILTMQGHLYMMGCNTDGQLGIGDNCPDQINKQSAGAPCLVDRLKDYRVESVACGKNFTFAITSDKQKPSQIQILNERQKQHIYAWGCNNDGQLGISTSRRLDLPSRVHFFEPENIAIKQISSGMAHTFFLTDDGKAFAAGMNTSGQLGIGQAFTQAIQPMMVDELLQEEIEQVSAGDYHSLFLTKKGEVFSCGNNQFNQLGLFENQNQTFIPTQVNSLSNYKIIKVCARQESAAITQQGELFLWGKGIFGHYKQPQKILTISNPVTDISLGGTVATALDNKGLLWTWGSNEFGELGVGDHDSRVHPYPILTLKGKKVTQLKCGERFVVALGMNLKKEIPQLKLKDQAEKQREQINKSLQRLKSSEKYKGQTSQLQHAEKKDKKHRHNILQQEYQNQSMSDLTSGTRDHSRSVSKSQGRKKSINKSKIKEKNTRNKFQDSHDVRVGRSSSTKMLRRESAKNISQISQIYGGYSGEPLASAIECKGIQKLETEIQSPREREDLVVTRGRSKLTKKNSRSSISKSKLSESMDKSKSRKLKSKSSKSKPSGSVPFSGEDTTIIKQGLLNSSGLINKNKKLKKSKKSSKKQGQHYNYEQQLLPSCFSPQLEENPNQSNLNGSSQDIINDLIPNSSFLNSQNPQYQGTNQFGYSSKQYTFNQHQSNHRSSNSNSKQRPGSTKHGHSYYHHQANSSGYIPSSSLIHTSMHNTATSNNKEKLIKDLNIEIKSLRTDNELLRKENKTLRMQMEQIEKQYDKTTLVQQHQNEMANLNSLLDQMESQIKALKEQKSQIHNQLSNQIEAEKSRAEKAEKDRDQQTQDKEHYKLQLQQMQYEFTTLQQKYHESQLRNQEYEVEVNEIQREINQLSIQSTQVERQLLDKVQSLSSNCQATQQALDSALNQAKQDRKKLDDLQFQVKDSQFYTSALEKENGFLREEIEKVKFHKDKDQYGKFLTGLVPIRGVSKKNYAIRERDNSEKRETSKSPFKENSTHSNCNTSQVISYNYPKDCLKDRSPIQTGYGNTLTDKINTFTLGNNQQDTENDDMRQSVFSNDCQPSNYLINSKSSEDFQLRKPKNYTDKENEQAKPPQPLGYDINELRQSYNQKLLKSIEKKTMNKFR